MLIVFPLHLIVSDQQNYGGWLDFLIRVAINPNRSIRVFYLQYLCRMLLGFGVYDLVNLLQGLRDE